MLELAKRHGVCVEIGDFFEFQCGLRGDGQHVSPAKEEQMGESREVFGDAFDLQRAAKHAFHDFWEPGELVEREAVFSKIFSPLDGVKKRQEHHRRELRRKRLGGCHANLGSCPGEESEIRQSRYRRPHDVDYSEGLAPLGFDEFERLDGVCGFARLRDENVERLVVDAHRTIQKFAGDLRRRGHAREFPEGVSSRPSGMVRRSACDEFYALDVGVAQILEGRGVEYEVFKIRTALENRLHDPGLFVDFLEHEVFEIALVRLEAFGFDPFERAGYERSFGSDFVREVALDPYQVAVVEKSHLVSVSGQRLHVRREEAFAGLGIPSKHQGASVFDADEFSWKIRVHHEQGVGAFEAGKHGLDCLDEGVRTARA